MKIRKIRRIKRRLKRNFIKLFCAGLLIICFATAFGRVSSYARTGNTETSKYFTSYEIVSGDTLESIADRFCTEEFGSRRAFLKEVRSINALSDFDHIRAGSYLIIPYYSAEEK
ncbi:MAG: LysM peptidoglycan-binding domain-containing protein [Lachnospiraceae bacterium]|nr:LysM peptidoglycan-binding domain-containing protein [Lachnospiraceae bacterium]